MGWKQVWMKNLATLEEVALESRQVDVPSRHGLINQMIRTTSLKIIYPHSHFPL